MVWMDLRRGGENGGIRDAGALQNASSPKTLGEQPKQDAERHLALVPGARPPRS